MTVRWKTWLAALLAVTTALCLLLVAVQRSPRLESAASVPTESNDQPALSNTSRAKRAHEWTDPLGASPIHGLTVTVFPGIHLIGRLGPSAAYAIETSAGIVLVDSGLDDDAHVLKAEMARLSLDWKQVRAILLTHVHGDHCGGAENLRAATAATIYAGREDASILRAGTPREAFFSIYKMPDHTPHPTTVDVELSGNERFEFGEVHVEVLGTPGHTPGSICYLMERDSLRVLFSGDVIQNLGAKPLGTYTAYLPPRFRGDAEAYLATLEKLRKLPAPDLVLPGHPGANSGPTSPHLSSGEWHEMLDRGIREMQELVEQHALDGEKFLDGQSWPEK
jgi:metallo-beta-lactamase class B